MSPARDNRLRTTAACLASSDLCGVQAFRDGSQAYGLSFRLAMERTGMEALCRLIGHLVGPAH